ncbi:hypothetical protein V1224_04940 [Lachnospiraceae bacterium JLR.KK008]
MKKDNKAVAACIGIAALVLLYLLTLVTAFLDIPNWDRLFQSCLTATIGIPILLWIYLILCRKRKEREEQPRD